MQIELSLLFVNIGFSAVAAAAAEYMYMFFSRLLKNPCNDDTARRHLLFAYGADSFVFGRSPAVLLAVWTSVYLHQAVGFTGVEHRMDSFTRLKRFTAERTGLSGRLFIYFFAFPA